MDTINTTKVYPLYKPVYSTYYTYITETDEEIISIINYAHKIGLKVMFKP